MANDVYKKETFSYNTVPGAPSYVRQSNVTSKYSQGPVLPVNPLPPSPTSDIGGGAPSYIKRNEFGEIKIIDTGIPEVLEPKNVDVKAANAKAKKIAEDTSEKPDPIPTKSGSESLKSTATKLLNLSITAANEGQKYGVTASDSKPVVPSGNNANYSSGGNSRPVSNTTQVTPSSHRTQRISNSVFSEDASLQTPTYQEVELHPSENSTMPKGVKRYRVYEAKYKTSWQQAGRRAEMLNQNTSLIQNEYQYPRLEQFPPNDLVRYNYQFIPGDGPSANIEDLLSKVRMQYGIQVHGNPDLERNVRYYMYNRFKTPDWGLAHSKTFTHVFFTRPDLYLMESESQPSAQLRRHSEMSMIYRRHPDLVRLLCNGKKMQDGDNFNMLLSQQCVSFPIQNEGLSKLEVGKSWNDHKVVYGDGYTGRFAGEFSCTFNETADYSVSNLIKLWITYIDNVSRGAMSPYYGHRSIDSSGTPSPYGLDIPDAFCHVHDKTLDYAASVYVLKVDPTGDDLLYWSKYYGVFPITTGSSALSWEAGQDQSTPRLDITFAYSWKEDLTPISLIEFNYNSYVEGDNTWVPSYDPNLPGSARPLVGAPYIEFIDKEPEIERGGIKVYNTGNNELESIKLRFRPDTAAVRNDDNLFRTSNKNAAPRSTSALYRNN